MNAGSFADSVQSRISVTPSSSGEWLNSRFLEGLERQEVDAILAAATIRNYFVGSVVANQGDPADYFYLLKRGCARLFFITHEGQKVLLRWLPPGEILGGAALLPATATYLVGTEIVKDSSMFAWHRNAIRRLAGLYPRVLENVLPFAMDHLAWFLAAHMALISNTARERLAQVLLTLAQGIGHKVSSGVRLDITNEQLANAANITPFTASRLLSEWQRNGAVTKGRGTLILRAPHRLFLSQV